VTDTEPFRLRRLLNPAYLALKVREIRSLADLFRRVGNIFVYIGYHVRGPIMYAYGEAVNVGHAARGRVESWYDDASDILRCALQPRRLLLGSRPSYQSAVVPYVAHVLRSSKALRRIIDAHAGGFGGKIVLEVGAGFAMPHGGAYAALAVAEGAVRVTAVDRDDPDLLEADPARVAFWSELLDRRPDVAVCGVHIAERVAFEGDRLELARMDAAALKYPDAMFDLAYSTAVFEHLVRPQEALRELRRVLKPGGRACILWNPFTSLRLGGHDIGLFLRVPWAHLRLSETEHVRALAEFYSNPTLYEALPIEHRPNPNLARRYAADPLALYRGTLGDLNRLRLRTFRAFIKEQGWRILWESCPTRDEDCRALTSELRRELADYDEEELVLIAHEIVLEKPAV
jgi:SAM-dependent methyltransferase